MRSLFFGNKIIEFTNEPSSIVDFTVASAEEIDTTKVLQKLENNNSVLIKADDCDEVYRQFCLSLECRIAAGGVVENSKGEYLMMFRNDKWDLPKGHLEHGETLEECAIREVEEECGVRGLIIGKKITITNHAYLLHGSLVIKQSHWYAMDISKEYENMSLTPQNEEGITMVEWVAKGDINLKLKDSYETIRSVMIERLKMK